MKFKKWISLLLAVVLAVSSLAASTIALADTSGDFEYRVLSDGSAEITNYTGFAKEITIPTEIDGYDIVGISRNYEENNYTLEKITVPDGIDYIYPYAFYRYKNLAAIVLEADDIDIYGDAVLGTAFYNNKNNWENGVLYLDNYCIRGDVDYDYGGTLEIKDSVEIICSGAFAYSSLSTATFNNTIKEIIVPDSVKKINSGAFGLMDNLEIINLGSGVEYLGYGDDGCWYSNGWFNGYSTPKAINVDEGNKYFSSSEGVLFNKDKTVLIDYPAGKQTDTYIVPNTVKTIASESFSWKRLQTGTVTIPESVELIETDAFDWAVGIYDFIILNPNIEMDTSSLGLGTESSKPSDFTIYSFENSAVQTYAEKNGINFVAINRPTEEEGIVEKNTDKTYILGSEKEASIYCTYDLEDFVSVEMDGKTVEPSNYTLAEGSTILTFNPDYLDTLAVGEHTVTLNYTNASVSSVLTIIANTTASEENTTSEPESISDSGTLEENDVSDKTEKVEPDNQTQSSIATGAGKSTKSPSTGADSAMLAALSAGICAGTAVLITAKGKHKQK